ncbi:MFS transporter (plasmid) [Pseudomonas luteola]
MMFKGMNRQVALLASAQALIQTVSVMVMTIGGLVGSQLAPSPSLATAPIAGMFLGTAITMFPASIWMSRVGREKGFRTGAGVGLLGALLATSGVYHASFLQLCLGTVLVGVYQGFAQFYRFAASEAVTAAFRTKAISLVMAGGIVAAVAGPLMARLGSDLLAIPYLGSFVLLVLATLIAVIILFALNMPQSGITVASDEPARSWRIVVSQPTYLIALYAAASGFGLMALAMTATPLAMTHHAHPLATISSIIQLHVLAMYLPSFVTGRLIERFGAIRIMLAGVVLFACHFAVALSGTGAVQFASALIFVGLGWNFLYIGGTSLVTSTVTASEKGIALGINDMTIFVFTLASSLSAGMLVNTLGWHTLNLLLIPWAVSIAMALLWLACRRGLRMEAIG